MDELKALLRAREPLYAQAELVMDTSKLSLEEIVERIAQRFGPSVARKAGRVRRRQPPSSPA
jgi:RNase adaptor protein for sRNA GlmZ degradation